MKRLAAVSVVAVALLVPAAARTHAIKEGGTFRVGVDATFTSAVDPALVLFPGAIQFLRPKVAR